MQFLEDGRAVIHAFKSADVSTVVHELGHIWRRETEGPGLKILEDWAGVREGLWKTSHEEKVARAVERYLSDGTAPTEELKPVFAQFKEWIVNIYRKLVGEDLRRDILTPEVRQVFDSWLSPAALEKLEARDMGRAAATEATAAIRAEAEANGIPQDVTVKEDWGTSETVTLSKQGQRSAARSLEQALDALSCSPQARG